MNATPQQPIGATGKPSFPIERLDYYLPEDLIAQEPAAQRDAARMLVVHRDTGQLQDRSVRDVVAYLRRPDVLVLNDTRVLPARFAIRRSSGGRIEGLFLAEDAPGCWEVLLRGAKRLKIGEQVRFDTQNADLTATVIERLDRGRWRLRLDVNEPAVFVLDRLGRMPLPPYIHRDRMADPRDQRDRERYQTIYATADGAVAAPTAGLHFTPELLDRVRDLGVAIERVTLHVGYGTFAPVEVDDLAAHDMHQERFEIAAEVAARLTRARAAGGRIVAVGTTSARVLESAWKINEWNEGCSGWTGLFCYPPYRFTGVDMLLTNFHLPRSTLIALVMAFAGEELIRAAYAHAVQARYRFYSYGDAMLIC